MGVLFKRTKRSHRRHMKKQFTRLLLLIWRLSQPLLAVVSMTSSTRSTCSENAQSTCALTSKNTLTNSTKYNTAEHMGHNRLVVFDSGGRSHDQWLMNVEDCATVCKVSVVSNHFLSFTSRAHSQFDTRAIDAIVDIFLGTPTVRPFLLNVG